MRASSGRRLGPLLTSCSAAGRHPARCMPLPLRPLQAQELCFGRPRPLSWSHASTSVKSNMLKVHTTFLREPTHAAHPRAVREHLRNAGRVPANRYCAAGQVDTLGLGETQEALDVVVTLSPPFAGLPGRTANRNI